MHYHIQLHGVVNEGAYMDFKKATDALFSPISHADLARAMDVSVPLVRQARLDRRAKAYRSAPAGWEHAVVEIAEGRISAYRKLIDTIRNEVKPPRKRDRLSAGG